MCCPRNISEFEKLQDAVPPFAYAEVARLIAEEFGRDVKDVFEEFASEPLASASIAQAHLARTKTGQEVIVKVQRPQIRQMILQDLAIMEHLAHLLARRIPESRRYDPVGWSRNSAKPSSWSWIFGAKGGIPIGSGSICATCRAS